MQALRDAPHPEDPTGEVHAELERVQGLLAEERRQRQELERKLAAIEKPPAVSGRPQLLPWIVAVLVGVLIGMFAYHMLAMPAGAHRPTSPALPLPLKSPWP